MSGFPTQKNGRRIGEPARNPRPGIPVLKSDILPLIKHYHGNISRVAEKLGTTRHLIRRKCDADPELGLALEDARERFIDNLEQTSWDKALAGDTLMAMFLLKTIGRQRGYDQDLNRNQVQDIAKAAFEFVINKSKSPVEIECSPQPSCESNAPSQSIQ